MTSYRSKAWDSDTFMPKPYLKEIIDEKISSVSSDFGASREDIIPVAVEIDDEDGYINFNMPNLLLRILNVVPNENRYAFYREASKDASSEEVSIVAKKGTFDSLKQWIGDGFDWIINALFK
ncbi:hypothetical protein F9L16_23260 [Agarivorans sp. B2Z047]|uniref:hypothetical protein n=1 Tax=Agarivorans sp. B2Z047 TaxID=2652721 RepID=UPI00128D8DB8|nr:hypothetical protein [Agarivorans sp. B2Z047]MPW31878.1 hypothetical protein [Agarivorans sp. B2Z047]UQN43675.1 hypothetical protein LQZ07_04150 [Agarivorans sp. B2Z047]